MNKSFRTALVLAFFACASLLLTVPASAQSVYGSIFGTVTDKTGAADSGRHGHGKGRGQGHRRYRHIERDRATTASPTLFPTFTT